MSERWHHQPAKVYCAVNHFNFSEHAHIAQMFPPNFTQEAFVTEIQLQIIGLRQILLWTHKHTAQFTQ